ncbi:MAG: hypothetical protein ACNI27_06275 [Desulfovibrio sp.]
MGGNRVVEEIVLKVDRDEYSGLLNPDEIWQKEAAVRLCKALDRIGKVATMYFKSKSKKREIQQAHDAIFVSASRGCGKTAFLLNIKNIWEKYIRDCEEEYPKLHFCSEIDPTLLAMNDNFVNVVIAHLFNEVEQSLRIAKQSVKEEFYRELSRLAESLGQYESHDGLPGIDRIVSYKSGIQLRQAFQSFVEVCLGLVDADAIVIPIDDVDMALRQAFDVLDVVRRLLSCPYIIPVVSGDDALYRPLIRSHFRKGGKEGRDQILLKGQATDLTDAYLTKIFPNQNRLALLPLERLVEKMVLKDKNYDDGKLPAYSYLLKLRDYLCPFVNGQERSYDYPEARTARQLMQLVKSFPPSILTKDVQFDPHKWYAYQNIAESRLHGTAYLVADAEQTMQMVRNDENDTVFYPLRMMLGFNITKQAEHDLFWKKHTYLDSTLTEFFDEEDSKGNRQWVRSQHKLLEKLSGVSLLKSMPPVELYFETLYVSQQHLPKVEIESIWAKFYLHHSNFGAGGSKRVQVFFGRAFEFVVESLLLARKGTRGKRFDFWEKYIQGLLATSPYYSIYDLSPTKTLGLMNGFLAEEIDEHRVELFRLEDQELEDLSLAMVEWEAAFVKHLKGQSLEGVSQVLLLVMNKVFTQLHLMKVDNVFNKDCLQHSVKRFQYVLLNGFATFLKSGLVVHQGVANGDPSETLLNDSVFEKQSQTLRNNIAGFEAKAGSEGDVPRAIISNLKKHPLFELVNTRGVLIPLRTNEVPEKATEELDSNYVVKSEDTKAKIKNASSDTGPDDGYRLKSTPDYNQDSLVSLMQAWCDFYKKMKEDKVPESRLSKESLDELDQLAEHIAKKLGNSGRERNLKKAEKQRPELTKAFLTLVESQGRYENWLPDKPWY